jgi:hypothetical protein
MTHGDHDTPQHTHTCDSDVWYIQFTIAMSMMAK